MYNHTFDKQVREHSGGVYQTKNGLTDLGGDLR